MSILWKSRISRKLRRGPSRWSRREGWNDSSKSKSLYLGSWASRSAKVGAPALIRSSMSTLL